MPKALRANLGTLLLLVALLAGCGQADVASTFASHSHLFNSGQLKEDWSTAMAAMQTNGYVAAETVLNKMRAKNPSADQLAAINHAIKSINDQLFAAAEKGDANASNAIKQIVNQSR